MRQNAADMPQADAVVVLSGMLNSVPGAGGVAQEWGDPDRFFGGLELFAAGRAPKLVFTRGKLPWAITETAEGDVLRQFAVKQGVPAQAIVLTGLVENTQQEAAEVRRLFPSEWCHGVAGHLRLPHAPRPGLVRSPGACASSPSRWISMCRSESTTVMDFLPEGNALASGRTWRCGS